MSSPRVPGPILSTNCSLCNAPYGKRCGVANCANFDSVILAPPPLTSSIPMLLWCPQCGERHIDFGEWSTREHHTHACQECGHVWRPAIVATVGVQFLPGFKNAS